MMRYFAKLSYLWELQKKRTKVVCERRYVKERFGDILRTDTEALRIEMRNLRTIENPRTEVKKEIMDLEKKITEVEMYRDMIRSGDAKEEEFTNIINSVKKNFFK